MSDINFNTQGRVIYIQSKHQTILISTVTERHQENKIRKWNLS